MNKELIRKEVWLWDGAIANLQVLADKREWSLKKYMEHVLYREAKKAIKQPSPKQK